MNYILQALIFIGLVPLSTAFAAEDLNPSAPKLLLIDNGVVRVGIDRSMGASITWLSWTEQPGNVVNIHDPGRLIQQSYYAGKSLDRTADGQSKDWSPWSWNPIQGGGVSSWARVIRFERVDDATLFGETIPKLWDMPDEEANAVMRQWTSFEPGTERTIVVRNRIECNREVSDAWGKALLRPQEVPACYFTRDFDQFRSYLGGGKWRTEETSIGPPWRKATPPLNAMACFNDLGQGIAIYSPTANSIWNYGPHVNASSNDPYAGPCIHVAPISRVRLGPQSTYEYRYWITVGNEEQIAASLDRLMKKHSHEKAVLGNRTEAVK
ncbi:hypothetical protein [Novipirellula artificiosorum]|uniref:Secreted protein n=1 Tax=Novipirellula artificiosorum TaxID=2528016 RepID=A0A5C6DP61_9BACT|nr:hypothetical protein [Novipirellula artificiosorum]TWU37431.1 hypothetical protein Poly41_35620 [Novipirellula artificiosorum]